MKPKTSGASGSMNTCKTCWFWDKQYLTYGTCGLASGRSTSDSEETLFDLVADASDDQGLWAELRTGPNFGCVLHQVNPHKKPEENS